jgi:hypothetical protein
LPRRSRGYRRFFSKNIIETPSDPRIMRHALVAGSRRKIGKKEGPRRLSFVDAMTSGSRSDLIPDPGSAMTAALLAASDAKLQRDSPLPPVIGGAVLKKPSMSPRRPTPRSAIRTGIVVSTSATCRSDTPGYLQKT